MGIENLPFDGFTPILSIANFQRGDYKIWVSMKDKNNKLINFMNFFFVISPEKNKKN